MIEKIEISKKQQMLYTGMTSAQLHQAIIQDDANSQQALWYLLSDRMRDKLHGCFDRHFDFVEESARQWEDYLNDFYMYVYEYTPSSMVKKVHYYLLRRLEDNTKLEPMLVTTFKRYLIDEAETLHKARREQKNVAAEYRFNSMGDAQYNIQLIGFAIALMNQREVPVNRYILFRAICNRMMEDYDMIKHPSDEKVAALLNLTYGNYRTRTSRILSQLRDLLYHLTSKDVAELSSASKIMINRLSHNQVGIDTVISRLLKQAENDLPQEVVKSILKLRKEERRKFGNASPSIHYMEILPEPMGVRDSSLEFNSKSVMCQSVMCQSVERPMFDNNNVEREIRRMRRAERMEQRKLDILRFVRCIDRLFI